MVVNASEERSCRILTNKLGDEVSTSRVFVDESRDVVDEARNENKRPLGRLCLD